MTLYDGGSHIPLLYVSQIPATLDGRATHNVQNALFAAAMAYSMHVKLDDIRNGLQTFDSSFFQVPGRMNVFDEHPFKVILDYGHNPAAVQTMVDLVHSLPLEGRRIVVLASPGDRRDQDVREIGRIAAGSFDLYICRQDDRRRGREDGEVPGLLRASLLEHGVPEDRIEVIPDEREAMDRALEVAGPGDLVLFFADAVARGWKQITEFVPGVRSAMPEVTTPSVEAPSRRAPAVPLEVAVEGELIRDERGVRLAREQDD